MDAISRLLKPRSVAVIGASTDASKTAGRPIAYLRKHGFTGDIYPVNPRVEAIEGLRCYPDIKSLPAAPDVGLVLLGAARAHVAVAELAAAGTVAAIVLASGYSETGEAGARRQIELLEAAGPMRLLGPNTIGLVNLTDTIPLSASGALEMDEFPVGSIAVVSQSGGILGSLLSRAAGRGIGLSKLISTSNEADLDLADFVDHLADDPATKVIALYIEGVRNPAKFRAAAIKAANAGKPVVAYKIGRSEAGAKAAVSHTGALAGSDRMYDAMFAETGVIRAQTFSDLLDIPAALATGRVLRGKRVAILTSTGGAGTLVSDALGVLGFETPPPDAVTAVRLCALQSGDQAVMDRNPIDVTLAGLQPEVLRGAIEALLASPTYDALAIIVGSSGVAMPELMAGAIHQCLPHSDKPVVAYVSPHAPAAAALLTDRGVPTFTAPESCAAAFDGMWRATSWRPPAAASVDRVKIEIAELPTGALDEAQAKALFARFGVPCTHEQIVTTGAQADRAAREIGGKVVLKVLSADPAQERRRRRRGRHRGGRHRRPHDGGDDASRVEDRQSTDPIPRARDGHRGNRAHSRFSSRSARYGHFARHGRRDGGTAARYRDGAVAGRRMPVAGAGLGAGAQLENLAATRWLSWPPESRRRSAGLGDRRVLADGGAAG